MNCHRLVISTGMYGSMPVVKEVKQEANLHRVELIVLSTKEAIKELGRDPGANAIPHLTY